MDGDLLVIGDAVQTITFEFDNNNVFLPTNVPISLNPGTSNAIADAIVSAIHDPDPLNQRGIRPLSLSANHAGNGRVVLGITRNHLLDATRTPTLTAAGGVSAGESFAIIDDTTGNTVTFEFDNTGDAVNVAAGHVAVPFTSVQHHRSNCG